MSSWVSSPRASSVLPTSCLPQSTACSAPLSRSTRPGAPIAAWVSGAHAMRGMHTPCTRHAHCCSHAMLHITPGVPTTVWSRATTTTSRSEAWAIGATSRCCLPRGSRHGDGPTGGGAPLCETSTRTCFSAERLLWNLWKMTYGQVSSSYRRRVTLTYNKAVYLLIPHCL